MYKRQGNQHFDIVLGQREGVRKKPSPDAAFEICNTIEVDPKDVVFVGDTNVDIVTGIAAGMKTIGVLWGFREESELREAGAHYIVDKPNQILEIIDKGFS